MSAVGVWLCKNAYPIFNRGRIIQDLPKLRQLDEQEVSREERQEAGYVVSSDSEHSSDDDEKDQEDTRESTGLAVDGGQKYVKTLL